MTTPAQSPISPIVIPMEDEIIHTAENGYICNDADCPCKEELCFDPRNEGPQAEDLAEQEALVERRFIEIGFTERWECLPWNGDYW